jgi:membrane protease YdiL (CAAX protease family)
MSVTVGLFEAVFFRGFVQTRLEHSFGTAPGIAGAAVLYGLYHVGYGMGIDEIGFLVGLGVVYAVVFRLVPNVLVLWPLLTPVGSFFNNLEAGDIELPWASIAGFADVLVVMAVVIWFARRHIRKRRVPVSQPHEEAVPV